LWTKSAAASFAAIFAVAKLAIEVPSAVAADFKASDNGCQHINPNSLSNVRVTSSDPLAVRLIQLS